MPEPEADAQHPLRALTRRDVVVGGAAVGAMVVVGGRASAEPRDWPWIVRDGASARAQDFLPGQEVAALGRRGRDGVLVATRVEPTYRLAEGEVSARDGDRLRAGGETLQLTSHSHVNGAESLDGVAPGEHVVALGRRELRTGALEVAILTVSEG